MEKKLKIRAILYNWMELGFSLINRPKQAENHFPRYQT